MKRIISILAVVIVAAITFAHNSYAENLNGVNESNNEVQFDAKNRPEKPENEVMGKITAISADSITITIAEMKKPEGRTNPPENKEKNDNSNLNKEIPEMNMDDMFTLTNTTKTYNITNADLIKFKKPEFDKNDNNSQNNDATKKRTREELEKDSKATYTDFAIGDYVSIELESSTSTNAKKVRSFDRMGGGRGFNKEDKKK